MQKSENKQIIREAVQKDSTVQLSSAETEALLGAARVLEERRYSGPR